MKTSYIKKMAAVCCMVLTVIANAAEATECFNFFGFRPGMQKEAADELAAQYGLPLDKEHFKANPQTHEVYQMDFTMDEVLRITKGPTIRFKLVQFLAEKLRSLGCKIDDDLSYLSYEYESDDGIQVWIGREDLHYSWCTILDKSRWQVAKETENSLSDKAVVQEEDGKLNFFGFYTGMSKTDADALVAHYGLILSEEYVTFKENPKTHEVYEMNFTEEDVQKITRGPMTYEELLPIVAKQVVTPKYAQNVHSGAMGWRYWTIDGVEFNLYRSGGCSIFDKTRAEKAEEDYQMMWEEKQERDVNAMHEGIEHNIEEPDQK